ncbi:FUCL4 protein, partial [Polypterus senegalus]|nr:FUCL4 protein [Polypterus senegalus]
MALTPVLVMAGLLLLCGAEDNCPQIENVALRGKATQSQILGGQWGFLGNPGNAIDGNRNSNYVYGSCTHTESHNSPWWRVDLLEKHKIYQVVITNRGDCCPEKINGAEIRIGDSLENEGNSNPSCATITSIPAGISSSYNCNGMEGRYINVVIPNKKEYLTLCEVEVFGVPLKNHCSSYA